ncbi:GTPase-binding rid1 [Hyphodiscus hymeniophilus]|uniref:GTPase-binding rid1 n=1 Tax=Hyphodiscus hymeniophilus TaxID=353542 RepID=A0A9P6VJL4_9HELO|nr:GTPase-binding rid1 [Hyphodiscus hymeniophilus]
MATNHPPQDFFNHKRAKSSVLKSFMHKRTPSAGAVLASPDDVFVNSSQNVTNPAMQFLPADHPHSRALGELQQNQQTQPPSPTKPKRPTTSEDGLKYLHKKTLSSISLKSLSGKDSDKPAKAKEPKEKKPKKTKSSTNLATLLGRPKSSKSLHKDAADQAAREQKDKENRRPIEDAPVRPPPIYAQFSSEYFAKQPLGGKFLEDEIDLYTPQNYSPSKRRDFYEGPDTQPTLTRRDESIHNQRPKSTYLPSSFSVQDLTRRISNGSSRNSAEISRRVSGDKRPSFERRTTENSVKSTRGQRVMAAVSAFGSKPKQPDTTTERFLEDKDVDTEFEAMLDRRNIPEHQRGKMRSLAMSMKKDFVKQDWAEIAAVKKGRPGTNNSDSSADAIAGIEDVPEVKTKRPRSRTFTLSRASSKEPLTPSKKKTETRIGRHSQTNSTDGAGSGKSLTSAGAAVAQSLIAKAKSQTPDDFVSYLRKVRKPEAVEVGRLHKLRLLLRNETVAWTDEFIGQGGMEEIVGLLHRVMEVEWRQEHEDALLHEALLCLKALCTTALALQHLNNIQRTLFPALLAMIFDEEKKGPSEFTTRNIISWLLFTYLKSAPLSDRSNRARTLLSYLRDPEPNESQRPVGFVLDMRRSRPYRIWCKEVTNVTKEVFWIFLHNLNVVPLPGTDGRDSPNSHDTSSGTISSSSSGASVDSSNPHHAYMVSYFPRELPPVPAAPYVGGVEWDATNYLASHLDIFNGILACLPTQDERNTLREQLRVSGWERHMGCTLRLCKEKFYGGVHAGLRCWVAAAAADGWNTRDVRCGPAEDLRSPVRKSPRKAPMEQAPKIEMKLDFGQPAKNAGDDVWL